MLTKYSVGQGITLVRMYGMKNIHATVYEVHEDHLLVRTYTGQFVRVKERDIVSTDKPQGNDFNG